MSAIPLTVFLSLALAGLFTLLFWREQRRPGLGGPERDSLLPLAEEKPRPVLPGPRDLTPPGGPTAKVLSHVRQEFGRARPAATEAGHDHGDAPCGCRDGLHPPCVGCLRRAPAPR